ncbi:hypothetical protein [Mycolicibacterium smegmatis]|uniref:Uncharacterized protein n=1 Tax=Mycolicibacterium smegmatis (strain MKD8) TaxID=1214915 RepID=A0A2U9PQ28_MYCSE|nr:hypothetical protein [Mycolicibacterium smegmatis]AWT53851.1 hypothetical protein D806_028770 [Mycolicibacterium smegmatis MKD8]
METIQQSIDRTRERELEPTYTWQLARCTNIAEKSLIYSLAQLGVEVRFDDHSRGYITKADARKLMGLEAGE